MYGQEDCFQPCTHLVTHPHKFQILTRGKAGLKGVHIFNFSRFYQNILQSSCIDTSTGSTRVPASSISGILRVVRHLHFCQKAGYCEMHFPDY